MNRSILTVLLGVVLIALAPEAITAQQNGPALDVAAAIESGRRSREPLSLPIGGGVLCRDGFRTGSCAYALDVQGPSGRVHSAAAAAAKKSLPFTVDSVTAAMVADEVVVRVTPLPPYVDRGRIISEAPRPTHAVLRSADKRDSVAVQPLRVEPFDVSWSNLVGGTRAGTGLVAVFAVDALPAGDFVIEVVSDAKDPHGYLVRARERSRIR